MIKNIFLPEHIKNYYLFPKRIVGFDIGKTHISATQIQCAGKKTIIEKYADEKIENGTTPYQERAAKAIGQLLSSMDAYDTIHSALSSEYVIFKELRLPLLSHDKIKKVLPYEIEPLLPFKLTDATIDFIITKENTEEKSIEILVAAVQNQHIANHVQLFAAAGVSPEIITVDLFALYSLYMQIPEYAALTGGVALLDVGTNATRVAYIQDGQLRFIRTLTHGTTQVTKTVSDLMHESVNVIVENSMRFGVIKPDDPDYTNAMTTALEKFWQDISFTIRSFTMQADPTQTLSKIILLGGGAEIKGIDLFIENHSHIATEKFQSGKLFENSSMSMHNAVNIPSLALVSLSTALTTPLLEDFNLRKNQFATANSAIGDKQILVGSCLLLVLIGLLGMHTLLQTRKLDLALSSSKKEAIGALKEKFETIEEVAFDDVIESAKDKLTEKKNIVSAFQGEPFLKYLLELTNLIDAASWGFILDKLTISADKIVLDAQVRDFDSLKLLEGALNSSKIFQLVEPQQSPSKFTMELRFTESEES